MFQVFSFKVKVTARIFPSCARKKASKCQSNQFNETQEGLSSVQGTDRSVARQRFRCQCHCFTHCLFPILYLFPTTISPNPSVIVAQAWTLSSIFKLSRFTKGKPRKTKRRRVEIKNDKTKCRCDDFLLLANSSTTEIVHWPFPFLLSLGACCYQIHGGSILWLFHRSMDQNLPAISFKIKLHIAVTMIHEQCK